MDNLLNEVTKRIKSVSESPNLDAQVLLSHLTGKDRSWILAHPEIQLDAFQNEQLNEIIKSLNGGKPLAYIIGSFEFFNLEFIVTPDVLIPRPETELLVERGINWVRGRSYPAIVMDLGTGSGCIAITLAVHYPEVNIIATDISEKALQVAHTNVAKHKVADQVTLILCDLFPMVENGTRNDSGNNSKSPGIEQVDMLIANLPYIPTPVMKELAVFGKEPQLALDGGEDGLDVFRKFFDQAPDWVKPGGVILLEIEEKQGKQVPMLANESFPGAVITLYQDYSGRDRIVEIILKP